MRIGSIAGLPAIDPATGALNIVVETPQHARFKFKYEIALNLFRLEKALPLEKSFRLNLASCRRKGGDGDPLDVLALCEHATCRAV
jgi:hypothetical protein